MLPEISVCRRSWPAFPGRPAGEFSWAREAGGWGAGLSYVSFGMLARPSEMVSVSVMSSRCSPLFAKRGNGGAQVRWRRELRRRRARRPGDLGVAVTCAHQQTLSGAGASNRRMSARVVEPDLGIPSALILATGERALAEDEGAQPDTEPDMVAREVGIEVGAATAGEAAVHATDEPGDATASLGLPASGNLPADVLASASCTAPGTGVGSAVDARLPPIAPDLSGRVLTCCPTGPGAPRVRRHCPSWAGRAWPAGRSVRPWSCPRNARGRADEPALTARARACGLPVPAPGRPARPAPPARGRPWRPSRPGRVRSARSCPPSRAPGRRLTRPAPARRHRPT